MTTEDSPLQKACLRWSNRILIFSALGIAYLTLFPFEIRLLSPHAFHGSPFFLGESSKSLRSLDFFLNVLLFVPFGFGLSAQVAKRGGRRSTSFLLALALGAGVSYLVELLQLYIPGRDSGWEDVISNATGSVAGCFLFLLCGRAILEKLSSVADLFERWISPRRTALLLAIYFAACLGITVPLQRNTRLSNWDPQCVLVVGNDAAGENPWTGQVSLLQIWNRALPDGAIRSISRQESEKERAAGPLVSYDLTGAPPYRDQKHYLPALAATPERMHFSSAAAPELGAKSWLRTSLPVENLTGEIKKSNQFTVHVICAPASTENATGRIVSLSQSVDNVNFHLRQEGTTLVVWIRNPLSETHSVLAWNVRGALEPGKTRDIVATYDGSDAFLYLDGNRVRRVYRLSPGASLIHGFFLIKTADLGGYVLLFETLIFLPAGLLIGLQVGNWPGQKIAGLSMLVFGLLLPAILLEVLEVGVSGRRVWFGNIAMSVVFGLAGVALMKADVRHVRNSRRAA